MGVSRTVRRALPLFLGLGFLGLAAYPAGASTTGGSADFPAAATLFSAINGARAQNGLPALAWAADLGNVALGHSATMGANSTLFHNPSLATEVTGWSMLGENVGTGSSAANIASGFMASPEHRANILDPAFHQVGIGVVSSGDALWVTEDFRQPAAATHPSAVTAATPAPAPTSASAVRRPPAPAPVPVAARSGPRNSVAPASPAVPSAAPAQAEPVPWPALPAPTAVSPVAAKPVHLSLRLGAGPTALPSPLLRALSAVSRTPLQRALLLAFFCWLAAGVVISGRVRRLTPAPVVSPRR